MNRLFADMGALVSPRAVQLPPVVKFIEKYNRGSQPYPRQKTLLKIIFLELEELTDYDHMVIEQWMEETRRGGEVTIPLDLYERMETCRAEGRDHFEIVVFNGGRRCGKGFVGGKIAEYMVAKMIALGNPHAHYGVEESKDLYLDVLATQYSQAQGMLYNDIKAAVLNNDWLAPYVYSTSTNLQRLQTPSDRAREERLIQQANATGRRNSMRAGVASINIKPSAANAPAIRGRASFMQCYDEFAHGLDTGSAISSAQIYDAATPSLAQFGTDSMVYIPSSPWSKAGKFYELYEDALAMENGKAVNPHMLAFRAASWQLYYDWQYDPTKKRAMILPPTEDRSIRQREMSNPQSFSVEFRANFAEVENAYLEPQIVDSLFKPYPSEENNRNTPSNVGIMTSRYRAHADAGRSQDNFCFALGHSEVGEDGYLHVFIDLMKVWQPMDFEPDADGVRRVDYTVVLEWLRKTFKNFYITKFTMDQWNSALFIDQLHRDVMEGKPFNKTMGVMVDNHTSKTNFQRWERFKTACYQGWVHIPWIEDDIAGIGRTCLADLELRNLIVKNGNKVDHPDTGMWCFDDQTEILTEDGWKLFRDLDGTERVATRSGDYRIEWQRPTNYIDREYHGDMYHISNRNVDICITPNHRVRYIPKPKTGNRISGKEYIDTIEGIMKRRRGASIVARFDNGNAGVDDTISFGPYFDFGVSGEQKGKSDRWTDDEIRLLREWYPIVRTEVIGSHIGRSSAAVATKARQLGMEKEIKHSSRVLLPPTKTVDFARLFGFWLADGSKASMRKDGIFAIYQVKDSGVSWLDDAFERVGWTYTKKERRQSGYGTSPIIEFAVNNKWLAEFCHQAITDNGLRIPKDILLDWSGEQQRAFLEGFFAGDGTWSEKLGRYIRVGIKDKTLLDDMLAVLLMNGYGYNYYERKTPAGRPFYEISLAGWDTRVLLRDDCQIEKYDGRVYCVTVPNDMIVVRRNGRIAALPNCHNDMSDCISTVVADLLADQLLAFDEGRLTKVVGAAQGGYNVQKQKTSAAESELNAAMQRSEELYRQLGYL